MNTTGKIVQYFLLVVMACVGLTTCAWDIGRIPRRDLTPIAVSVPRKECKKRGGIPYDDQGIYLLCFE